MAFQLSTAQTSLTNLKKDLSDVPQATFLEWCNFVARYIYNKLSNTDPERYINQATTFTVSASPQTSALPATFKNINPLGCGFFEIDDNGDDTDYTLPRVPFGTQSKGFYIQGTNVVFTGIEDGTLYRLRFIPELTDFDALADYWTVDNTLTGIEIVRDEDMDYIVKALDVLYCQWDETPDAESLADQRFVRALSGLIENYRKEPDAFALPD